MGIEAFAFGTKDELALRARERDKHNIGVKTEDVGTQGWAKPLSIQSWKQKLSGCYSSAVASGRGASLLGLQRQIRREACMLLRSLCTSST